MSQPQPISSLAPHPATAGSSYMSGGASNLLLWFVIIVLIAWFLMYFLKWPTFVQKVNAQGQPTGVADAGRSLLAAVILALIIILIIWLFRSFSR